MKKALFPALIAAVLMGSAAAVATVMTPAVRLVDSLPRLELSDAIPKRFGEWIMDERVLGGVVNPQQAETLERIYSQIVTRTYVNNSGYRIMLSIAYGEDQRDSNQIHYPEVCYPAQGFQIIKNRKATIETEFGPLPVRRLESQQAQQRFEPITYWTTVGSKVFVGGTEKKIAEMQYGLKGIIPDGLLFRVSSIDRDSSHAFDIQADFLKQIVAALDPSVRPRISGL
jgi:EpsI family protein